MKQNKIHKCLKYDNNNKKKFLTCSNQIFNKIKKQNTTNFTNKIKQNKIHKYLNKIIITKKLYL